MPRPMLRSAVAALATATVLAALPATVASATVPETATGVPEVAATSGSASLWSPTATAPLGRKMG